MKIAFNNIYNINSVNYPAKSTEMKEKAVTNSIKKLPSFGALKPLDEKTKQLRAELKTLTPLMRDESGNFSLEKTSKLDISTPRIISIPPLMYKLLL